MNIMNFLPQIAVGAAIIVVPFAGLWFFNRRKETKNLGNEGELSAFKYSNGSGLRIGR